MNDYRMTKQEFLDQAELTKAEYTIYDRGVNYHECYEIPYTLYGDYVGGTVERSNCIAMLEECKDLGIGWVFDLARGYNSHQVCLDNDTMPKTSKFYPIILEWIEALNDYPVFDESHLSELEWTMEEEHIVYMSEYEQNSVIEDLSILIQPLAKNAINDKNARIVITWLEWLKILLNNEVLPSDLVEWIIDSILVQCEFYQEFVAESAYYGYFHKTVYHVPTIEAKKLVDMIIEDGKHAAYNNDTLVSFLRLDNIL